VTTIRVNLGPRSYPIIVGTNAISSLGRLCRRYRFPRRLAVITDTNLAKLHLSSLTSILAEAGFETVVIRIPPGERQKSLKRASFLYDRLLRFGFQRDSALIAFGGGVIGDLTGYVAATFRRGVRYVQVPTTLLAQVESSIGGKVGVNHPTRKNAVGAFYQPQFVLSDTNVLSTLPRREIVSGMGELLKYAFLSRAMLKLVAGRFDALMAAEPAALQAVVEECNRRKAKMISADEFETDPRGGRMVLNLGHTVGQALEVLSDFRLRHGEAVLVGLDMELDLARAAGILREADRSELRSLLQRVQYHPPAGTVDRKKLLKSIFHGKRTASFILPKGIGPAASVDIDAALARSIFSSYRT
jgi:3-dehydroquinate synthase